jgi:hypothetical protein
LFKKYFFGSGVHFCAKGDIIFFFKEGIVFLGRDFNFLEVGGRGGCSKLGKGV